MSARKVKVKTNRPDRAGGDGDSERAPARSGRRSCTGPLGAKTQAKRMETNETWISSGERTASTAVLALGTGASVPVPNQEGHRSLLR